MKVKNGTIKRAWLALRKINDGVTHHVEISGK